MVVSTAGGRTVARGIGSAWAAGQVRSLVERGYPAFVRSRPGMACCELKRRDGLWSASAEGSRAIPDAVLELVDVLNETEEKR